MSTVGDDNENTLCVDFDNGTRRYMRQVREEEYGEAYELIKLTAEAGDNIGLDEIPTLDYLQEIMQRAVAAGLYNEAGVLQELLIIKPAHVARHVRPTLGQLLVATRDQPVSPERLRALVRLGCELASKEYCGAFTACLVEVFYTCVNHLQVFRAEGFVVTCAIPQAGLLAHQSGYTMSYIMYRELPTAHQPQITKDNQLFQHPSRNQNTVEAGINPVLRDGPAFLPMTYHCSNGMDVRIRKLTPNDLSNAYKAFSGAMDQGYGVDELPTYETFVKTRIINFYTFVAEENTGDVVAYFNAGPSRLTRSQTTHLLGTANLVILPKYRNKGLGKDMLKVVMFLFYSCGFELIAGTMAIVNLPLIKSSNFGVTHIVGTVPKSIYFRKTGWTDLLVSCKSFKELSHPQQFSFKAEL